MAIGRSDTQTFQRLGQYLAPSMPTDESLRRFSWRIWQYFSKQEDDPFISNDSLDSAGKRTLDQLAAPPACGSLLDEMRATFEQWVTDPNPANRLQLVVMPPCDDNHVVHRWAIEQGYEIVDPPPREQICDHIDREECQYISPASKQQFGGNNTSERGGSDGLKSSGDPASIRVIVIPRLERWFLRHHNGLDLVRDLLAEIQRCGHHCVVGCNSWAWQFLDKSIRSGRLLPSGLTFNSFDADRLAVWFEKLAADEQHDQHVFRSTHSGENVLQRSDSGKLTSDYMATLAAQSLGIPWVAWRLWRRSLRFGPPAEEHDQQRFPDEQTIWVTPVQTLELPADDLPAALLTLQSLLIHDGLTSKELNMTTPSIDTSGVLPSLLLSNWIELQHGIYRCRPEAYPQIRSKLGAAGYPVDVL